MATREQLHKEVDDVPEQALERAHLVIEPDGAGETNGAVDSNGTVDWSDEAWQDVLPMEGDVGDVALLRGGMSDEERKRQQESLRELGAELEAEGFDGSEYLPELEALAATWPE